MDSANNSTVQSSEITALVVMGVSGCGKSSAAQVLSQALGWRLLEGDAYHTEASILKMRCGVALTDADREVWLQRLVSLLQQDGQERGAETSCGRRGLVLTCSALKRKYREQLRAARPGVGFVFLDLDFATALERVRQRPAHFFSPDLVASQFATLERPEDEPNVLRLDAGLSLEQIAHLSRSWLAAGQVAGEKPMETGARP